MGKIVLLQLKTILGGLFRFKMKKLIIITFIFLFYSGCNKKEEEKCDQWAMKINFEKKCFTFEKTGSLIKCHEDEPITLLCCYFALDNNNNCWKSGVIIEWPSGWKDPDDDAKCNLENTFNLTECIPQPSTSPVVSKNK